MPMPLQVAAEGATTELQWRTPRFFEMAASIVNPDPRRYRVAEVCLNGGPGWYPALLRRRRLSPFWRLFYRLGTALDDFFDEKCDWSRWRHLRNGVLERSVRLDRWWTGCVNPLLTREMTEWLVRDIQEIHDPHWSVWAEWDSDIVVVSDLEQDIEGSGFPARHDPPRRIAPNEAGLYEFGRFVSVGNCVWKWNEFRPPWPLWPIDADAVVRLCETPDAEIGLICARLHVLGLSAELAEAVLQTDDQDLRVTLLQSLKYADRAVLENGQLVRVVDALLRALDEPNPHVRGWAAEALGSVIGRAEADSGAVSRLLPQLGATLLRRLLATDESDLKGELCYSLGFLHYTWATPELIKLLRHDSDYVRGAAAHALGNLRAQHAVSPLRHALAIEQNEWAKSHFEQALEQLGAPEETKSP